MAELLRRWTRNPLGSPRAGSNPADYVEEVDFSFSIISSLTNFARLAPATLFLFLV